MVDTTVMVWAMPDTAMDTVLDTVMAVLMVMASASDTTAMVDTMARGLLMLSPRLMPIPTTMVDTMVIMVWATPDTAMDTDRAKNINCAGLFWAEGQASHSPC